jgi:hypothetical protein
MHELVTDRATGPAASEQGLVPIQALLADFAVPRFDRKQHRLPLATGFSDAHGKKV